MYFTDSNIPLAYTIIHDRWHEPSKEFIENNENSLFWSNLVQDEYCRKLENIIDDVGLFLETSEDILISNQQDFINYWEFENFILKRTKDCKLDSHKKRKILEQFWRKFNFYDGIAEIISSKFSIFIKDFENVYYKRDTDLNNIMRLHNCGLDNFKRYLSYAKTLFEWGVHKPDCKIITDAHDCGLHYNDLTFVSTDMEMIEKILKNNSSFLKIIEFKSLN